MKKNAVYLEQKSWPLFIVGVETVSLTPRFLRVFFVFFFFFPSYAIMIFGGRLQLRVSPCCWLISEPKVLQGNAKKSNDGNDEEKEKNRVTEITPRRGYVLLQLESDGGDFN